MLSADEALVINGSRTLIWSSLLVLEESPTVHDVVYPKFSEQDAKTKVNQTL